MSDDLFARFTERARQVVVLAQDEANALKHNYIGTEHLLLGLIREEEGAAARVLESLDVSLSEARRFLSTEIGEGDKVVEGRIPFTPRAKKALELALREALSLGQNYIGTEHILLGLVRENEGVASRYLDSVGADAERVRNEVIRLLSGPKRREKREPNRLDASFWRAALVGVLNALGDRANQCRSNAKGCEGCGADAAEAMRQGLSALGYESWQAFHEAEIYRRRHA